MVSLRILLRDANGVVEDLVIIDDMVRCQDKHQRVIAILRGLQRRKGDGRCRVAANRLEDDIFRQFTELSQLFSHQEAVLFIADNHRLMGIQTGEARDGFLQHGVLPVQSEKLFWIEFTGHRPQAATGATRHNHRK